MNTRRHQLAFAKLILGATRAYLIDCFFVFWFFFVFFRFILLFFLYFSDLSYYFFWGFFFFYSNIYTFSQSCSVTKKPIYNVKNNYGNELKNI